MSSTFDFLVQLSKLCQQELLKRGCSKSEPGNEGRSPGDVIRGTSPRWTSHSSRTNRSVKRSETNALPQEHHDRCQDDFVAPKVSLETNVVKKEDPENLNLKTARFQCSKCSYIATSYQELFIHRTSCTKQRQDGCPFCPEGAGLSIGEVDGHIKSVHMTKGEVERSEDGVYHCKKCNATFKSFAFLKRHMMTLKHLGLARCPLCRIALPKENLEAHNTESHSKIGTSYKCQICGAVYPSKLSFDRHVSCAHAKKKEYPCPDCDKVFRRTDSLQKHLRTHSDVRLSACSFCDHVFKSKDNLKSHISTIHFGEKERFQCRHCFYVFNDEARLDIHVRMYHEGRKLACQICGETFDNYSKKERHIEAHLKAYERAKEQENPPKKDIKTTTKKRKVVKKTRCLVESDSSAEEYRSEEDRMSEVSLSAEDVKEEESSLEESVNPGGETDSTNSRKIEKSGKRRKVNSRENCENRSPTLKGVDREKKCSPRYNKSLLSSNKCVTKRVRKSRLKDGTLGKIGNGQLFDSGGRTESVYPVKPSLTIPQDTLFVYANSTDSVSIDSYSSLQPDSIAEGGLCIDIDNIPQCETVDLVDLTSADIFEVEYVNAETSSAEACDGLVKTQTNDLAFSFSNDVLIQSIQGEVDSGVSLSNDASLDEPVRKRVPAKRKSASVPKQKSPGKRKSASVPKQKSPAKRKSASVPKQKSKRSAKSPKYPDLGKRVIVKNLSSDGDDFILPEFVIDEDDD